MFFTDKNSPERIRWNDAASLLGLTQTHRRGSDWMQGEIDEVAIQIFDLKDSPPLLFAEIDDELSRTIPRFSVQLSNATDPLFSDLAPAMTGDLIFDHHLRTFAQSPVRVLDFLTLERRNTIFALYDEVFLAAVTHEGLRAGLDLPDPWDAEVLAASVLRAASLTSQFFGLAPHQGLAPTTAARLGRYQTVSN